MVEHEDDILIPILDCFGGTDGGVSFVKLKSLLSEMVEKAKNGDDDAKQIVEVGEKFVRLIGVANVR